MKRGTPSHTKTARLMRRLGVPKYHVLGILEGLWHLTAREAERGNIGKLSDEDIAIDLGWEGKPSDLIAALVDCGWVDRCPDHRLVIHDWHDHADDATKKRVDRSGLGFVGQRRTTAENGGQNPPTADNGSLPKPEPQPKPEPEPHTQPKPPEVCVSSEREQGELDPRLSLLVGVGISFGVAQKLIRDHMIPLDRLEQYVEMASADNVNNRAAYIRAAISGGYAPKQAGNGKGKSHADQRRAARAADEFPEHIVLPTS